MSTPVADGSYGTRGRPLLILGARSLASEVADLLKDQSEYRLTGFVENMDQARCAEPIDGLPVHWVGDLSGFASSHWAICALGSTKRRGFTSEAESQGLRFATVVHRTAIVSDSSDIGDGTIICPGVIVASHASIGRHVFVNRGALIGHHTVIGSHTSIMPGANIAGSCTIGDGCFIGMGAIIVDHITIGPGCVIAAGSVVTKSLPGGVQVVGMPARIVKEGVDGL